MPEKEKENLVVQESTVSHTITMKVNGNNATIIFASKRNDEVCNQLKKMLLTSYLRKVK